MNNKTEKEDRLTLELLEVVGKQNDLSQRHLARHMGVALGLANSYLKRCVRKGFIKIREAPANRYLYYLTPKGFSEKSRLTAQYLSYSFMFYRKAGDSCMRLFARFLSSLIAVVILAGLGFNNNNALAATTVRVGTTNSISDATFFIADKKGYFKEEGIDVIFIAFDSAANMVAPLGADIYGIPTAGQLDVGGGATSVGLYNAAARGINIKIVADKGSMPPGYGFMSQLVRKDLIDSGKFKSFKDLKGLKVGISANGSGGSVVLHEALKKGGLKPKDVEQIFMGFPQMVMALQNKAIDAAFMPEPNSTQAIQSGAAVRFAGGDVIDPNHQLAVLLYGDDFSKNHPEVARKFMRAYIRAARDYNDALKDGRLAGANAEEIINILVQSTEIKNPSFYKMIVPHGCNPDGKVNETSLKKNLQIFKDQGLIKGDVSVEQVLDYSFADAVVKELGHYVPKKQKK